MSKRKRQARPGHSSPSRSHASPATAPGAPINVKSQAAFEQLLDGDGPLVVDFWAPWCGPCKAMAPAFEAAARSFAAEPSVRFAKVNTEQLPEVAGAFGIRSIPTLIVLLGGEVVDSTVGVTPEQTLVKMARRALDRSRGVTLGARIKRFFGPRDQAPGSAS